MFFQSFSGRNTGLRAESERPKPCRDLTALGWFPLELLYDGDEPRKSLLYAEYILYIYLQLKIPSISYKLEQLENSDRFVTLFWENRSSLVSFVDSRHRFSFQMKPWEG